MLALVGGRNASFEAVTQCMQTVLSGTAASPPGGAADGAVARVRFHSMDILISRGRCTMVCRHWHGALAVEKGKLGTTATSWEPRTSSHVTALVLRKPWDGPRFIWDDKLQQGEVLLPDGSVPLRRSARGTTLDDQRLPIGTRDHPAGLCVTRASKGHSEHISCECVTRSVTRALHQPAVEPTGGCYEEAVVVLGWRGWDEAAREARRETIATICFSPIHSLPGEELARLLRYAPEVVKQALQWHNSRAVQEGRTGPADEHSSALQQGSVQPAAGPYVEAGIGQMFASKRKCRSLPASTHYRGTPLFPFMRDAPSAVSSIASASAPIMGVAAAQVWRLAPHLMERLWRRGVPERCGSCLLYPLPEEQDPECDYLRVQPAHQVAVRVAEGQYPGASAAALHADKVDLEEHQPITYLTLQGSNGTWGLDEAGKGSKRRELPGTRLVTFETRGGGAGFRVKFPTGYLTTVLQKSATSLHGNELPDQQPAIVPNKVLLRIVPYLLRNTTAWAQAMQQCPLPLANQQLARWPDMQLQARCGSLDLALAGAEPGAEPGAAAGAAVGAPTCSCHVCKSPARDHVCDHLLVPRMQMLPLP